MRKSTTQNNNDSSNRNKEFEDRFTRTHFKIIKIEFTENVVEVDGITINERHVIIGAGNRIELIETVILSDGSC